MRTAAHTPGEIFARVLASLVGSWGFVWGFCALGITALFAAGVDYWEAYRLMMMLAFIVFLVLFCWAFAARSVLRVWTVMAVGGGAMTLLAWQITRQLAAPLAH